MIAAAVIDRAESSLGEALPRLGGAIVLLVLGLVVAWALGRVTWRALAAVGLDRLAERFGVHDVIERVGVARSLSKLVGRAVRIALSVVVVVAAVTLLGLGALSSSLNAAVLFLPKLLVALVLVLAGVVVADFARDWVDRVADQMALDAPLGRVAQAVVLAILVLTAVAQLGVSTTILTGLIAVLIVAIAFTLALAFGLGSRDVARQLSAGRYVGGAFTVGQRITVAGISGEIVALQTAATALRGPDGRTLRVPNHMLLESVVTVEDAPAGP